MSKLSERECAIIEYVTECCMDESHAEMATELIEAIEGDEVEIPAALKWTTDPPTVPGTYWVGKSGRKWTVHFGREDLGTDLYPDDEGYKFCGPIQEPSE